jgi:hypothetical protein
MVKGVRSKVDARMYLKIKPPWRMPKETRRVGMLVLEEKSAYRLIGDKLFEKLNEVEFADLYPAEGQPGLSPVIHGTVFNYIESFAVF